MDKRAVQDFYNNKAMRQAVKDYFLNSCEQETVEMVFSRKDVAHIADAVELLNKVFGRMEVEFAPKKRTTNTSPR